MAKTITTLLLIVISQCLSLKVYQSIIGNNYGVAGLHYLKKENQNNVDKENEGEVQKAEQENDAQTYKILR